MNWQLPGFVALASLAQQGLVDAGLCAEATERYGIDTGSAASREC